MTTTIKAQIKSHGWHNVEINGNLITGDTYDCKDLIKKYLGGKWDNERKGWVVDPEMLAKRLSPSNTILIN